MLWRLQRGDSSVLSVASDSDGREASLLASAVSRDAHKAKAFIRFQKVEQNSLERFSAYHVSDHYVLRIIAPFLQDRFSSMNWEVITPLESLYWDGQRLQFGPGKVVPYRPTDEIEELWKDYYKATFNPSRMNRAAMLNEMPLKYWDTLPEAALIPDMMRTAFSREQTMVNTAKQQQKPEADPLAKSSDSISELQTNLNDCRACELFEPATQVVPGEGNPAAEVMLIGEQPGDNEDRSGKPFVGPAGQLLDSILSELGISRGDLFITNSVKHFHFEQRGKARIHAKPKAGHLRACSPWLFREIDLVQPKKVVCLGATASRVIFGPEFKLTKQRGEWFPQEKFNAMATYHPSALLRVPREDLRKKMRSAFISDLAKVFDVSISPI